MDSLEIVLPECSDDEVSDGLRTITRALHKNGHDIGCGLLGGEYGYGAEFDSDVFEMRWDRQFPECDCGGSKPKHDDSCDQVTKRRGWLDERNRVGMVDSGDGWMTSTETTWDEQDAWMEANPFPACTCGAHNAWVAKNGHEPTEDDYGHHLDRYEHRDDCDLMRACRPNFTHKPSGSTVHWYKYIGRDMEVDLRVPWADILSECLAAIPPVDRTPGESPQ